MSALKKWLVVDRKNKIVAQFDECREALDRALTRDDWQIQLSATYSEKKTTSFEDDEIGDPTPIATPAKKQVISYSVRAVKEDGSKDGMILEAMSAKQAVAAFKKKHARTKFTWVRAARVDNPSDYFIWEDKP